MRTYTFKNYLEMNVGKFLPMQTIVSESYGRHFFIDSELEFVSAPTLQSGGYDESQLDYVTNWTEFEGIVVSDLFDIYKNLIKMEKN